MNSNKFKINDSVFNSFTFQIIRDFTKPKARGFILKDINQDQYIYNLNLFDCFDYIRIKNPKQLLKTLIVYMDDNGPLKGLLSNYLSNDNNKDHLILKYIIQYEKVLYDTFQKVINNYKIIIHGFNYSPTNDQFLINKEGTYLNLYKKKTKICDFKANPNAKFPHINKLIRNICGNDENYNYFLKLLSYKLKKPVDLVPCHIIISDNGGTGKSDLLYGDILEKIYEVEPITQQDLMLPYNSYMVGNSFIWCEELEGFEDEKKLKALTGAKYIRLNEKYEKAIKVKNHANFIICSNELKIMKITEHDRRWSFMGAGLRLVPLQGESWKTTLFCSKEENEQFFKGYHKNLSMEINNFISYLLSLNVSRQEIQIPLDNEFKDNQININKTSEYAFADELVETGLESMLHTYYYKFNNNMLNKIFMNKISGKNKGYWVSFNVIYEIYTGFCKFNGYKNKLSKNVFSKKIMKYDAFIKLFGIMKNIKFENKTILSLKITNYVDENNNIKINKTNL